MAIDSEIDSWSYFEQALRQDNRVLFSKMMSEARIHTAAFDAGGRDPTESLLMALVIEQQKAIKSLLKELSRRQAGK